MRILLIGGTGTISAAVAKQLAREENELYLLNRGTRKDAVPEGAKLILADIGDEEDVRDKLAGLSFDCVCEFVGFLPEHVKRDFRLFAGKTKQYIFISSASVYHKPAPDCMITEGTTLANPYWEYSRNKIACEEYLMRQYREKGFPVTIVRPSHTYDNRAVPAGVHGRKGSFQVLKRMMEKKRVLIPGDGTSLWTVTHASDFAAGFSGLIGNPRATGEAFHITSDETLTWNQIYRIEADALGVKLKPYHVASPFLASVSYMDLTGELIGDKANSASFDNSKLKRAVGDFHASVRAERGIRDSVRYILSHSECQQADPEFDRWCDRVIRALERAKTDIAGLE